MRDFRDNYRFLKATLLAVVLAMGAAKGVFAQSTGQNYIRTREFTNVAGSTYRDKIVYHDGLGRTVQTVEKGASPMGADLVSFQEYDLMGRESNQWIPAVVGGNNGNFVPLASLKGYYPESYCYSRPVYEPSPLNRVYEQYGPGMVWQTAGKGVKTAYLTNVAGNDSLNCIPYQAENSYGKNDTLVTINRKAELTVYPTGALSVIRTSDEDGRISWEFKDKQERTILVRQLTDGTFLDTYYVYDALGNLTAVLPPAASDLMRSGSSWKNDSSPFLRQYAYLYLYDGRNRCKAKRLPGSSWTYYVYDSCDQLIFSQDGEQRKRGEWSFSIPDELKRPAVTGICKNSMGGSGSSPLPGDPLANAVVKATRDNSTGSYKGYALDGVTLTDSNVLQVNYYDDYNFMGTNGIPTAAEGFGYRAEQGFDTRYTESAKAMLTGTLTAVLDPVTASYMYLPAVLYYDSKHRIVQAVGVNSIGGMDREYSAYDFTGQVLAKKLVHTATGKPELNQVYGYTYDSQGRLLTVIHTLNNGASVVLAANEYDELCRLKKKSMHNGTITNQYTYNIRNWTMNIQGSIFSQTLHYTDGKGTPYYNGNISSMNWKTGNESSERGYTYTYDSLNRLIASIYGEGVNLASNPNRFNEQVTGYDKQGNILGIKRSGKTTSGSYDLIDNLVMAYNGNQLTKVTDNAVNSAYPGGFEFKDGANQSTEYLYDANGNLIKDLNKKISNIQYNYLNLPARIQFEDGSTIDNVYGADGTKLRTTRRIGGTTTVTDYCGNVIYENGSPKTILTESGFISLNDNRYHFYLQDHQGNNRVVADQNGTIEEVNHYYPFGGIFESTASVQPYKYNGKELDRSKGLDWYDYGARQYDAAIGRFMKMDRFAEKYVALSPYQYAANNPVSNIDINGDSIAIFYGKGNYFVFDGKNQNKAPKDEYVQSFIKAYNYNVKNGGGENLKKAAMEKDKYFMVMTTEGKSYVDNHNPKKPFMAWNDKLGLETDEGYRISPATALEHEMDHLYKEQMTSDKDYGEYRKTTNPGTDSQYDTKEERRVITGSEARTARANGEYPKNYMRKNHEGRRIKTDSPISNRKIGYIRFTN